MHDVIIVGAGPGGSAAAISLARCGWRVLLIEKHTFPRDKVCGDLVSPRSIRVLDALGCGDAVRNAAQNRLTGGTLYVNGEKIASAPIPAVDGLHNYGYGIPRLVFDEILFRHAQSCDVETVEGCTVVDMMAEDGGVTVQARLNRRPVMFRGRLVIGADGAHSMTARALGLGEHAPQDVIVALRAYYEHVAGDPEQVGLFFDDNFFPGYGWIFHLGNGRANVGLGMVRDVYQRNQINLMNCFQEWVDSDPHVQSFLGGARLQGRVVGWPLNTYRKRGGNYGERMLLVGDAGSFVDPINGEGIHTALETALIASSVADEALRCDDCSAAFLARYEARWRAELDLDLQMSSLIVRIIQNRPLLPLWMTLLRIIGATAGQDAEYAAMTGGILAGVVPSHLSASPALVARTLMHGPAFWGETLDTGSRLDDVVSHGLVAGSRLVDAVSGMLQEPGHSVEWGLDVAHKGNSLMWRLGRKYVGDTLRYLFGEDDELPGWP